MHFVAVISGLRFQDVVDILFLTIVAYHLYIWFRGTKALKALLGLLGLGIIYTVARTWGLFLTTWAFQILWQVLVILLIILFQSEIRQVLERVNPLRVFGIHRYSALEKWIPGFVEGIFTLARKKIGALVIIEREDRVQEFISEGQSVEGDPSPELLMTIFHKESPLHDGAVLIREGRVKEVACYMPLSSREGLPKHWGTRHRAALGLSEKSDAWIVVVSEERGEVSVARGKEMVHTENGEKLSNLIMDAMAPVNSVKQNPGQEFLFLFSNRWGTKVSSLSLVFLMWLMFAGQQEFETTVTVPVGTKNLGSQFEIIDPIDPQVEITMRGLRKDASILNQDNVVAEIDMDLARLGRRTFSITRENIRLPNDRINVVNIQPTSLKFNLGEKTLLKEQ